MTRTTRFCSSKRIDQCRLQLLLVCSSPMAKVATSLAKGQTVPTTSSCTTKQDMVTNCLIRRGMLQGQSRDFRNNSTCQDAMLWRDRSTLLPEPGCRHLSVRTLRPILGSRPIHLSTFQHPLEVLPEVLPGAPCTYRRAYQLRPSG